MGGKEVLVIGVLCNFIVKRKNFILDLPIELRARGLAVLKSETDPGCSHWRRSGKENLFAVGNHYASTAIEMSKFC